MIGLDIFPQIDSGVFTIAYEVGTIALLVFIVQWVLTLTGMDSDGSDFDIPDDADFDNGQFDTEYTFQWFTLRNLVTFITFTSWGIVAYMISGTSETLSIIFGLAIGIIAVIVTVFIYAGMYSLETKNTPSFKSLLNKEAKVYLRIPADGVGKIEVMLNGSLQYIDAKSLNTEKPTGSFVKVVEIIENNSIVVVD